MTLPIISTPTVKVTIPSTGKEVSMRPMLVKDEKVLLTAKEGATPAEIFQAIRQVIQNCLLSEDNVWNLSLFDVEWLYIKLSSISLGSTREVTFTDREDGDRQHKFTIDLDKVAFDREVDNNLKDPLYAGDLALDMRYPTAAIYDSKAFTSGESTSNDIFEEMAISSLVKCYQGDKTWVFAHEKREDVKAFIDNLPLQTYNKIREFLSTIPTIYYKIEYKNSKGEEKNMELKGLMDFFFTLS